MLREQAAPLLKEQAMTDQELRDLVADLAQQIQEMRVVQAEADVQIRAAQTETDRQLQATDRQLQATDRQLQATDHQLEGLARQAKHTEREIGGLANKFGGFTEGLAWPSLVKIFDDLHLDVSGPRIRSRHNGESIELDAFAYSNSGVNLALVAEVKSRLREEHLDKMKKKLKDFPKFFPGHKNKELRGLIAAVDIPEELAKRVLREGIYLARIHDDTFRLIQDDDFKPRAFNS
jgi:hypothetical protein